MEVLLFIITPCLGIFLYYAYKRILPTLLLAFNSEVKQDNDFHFPVAISAMKEYSLTRIALNRDESKSRIKEALYQLKRHDKGLHNKVKLRIT